MAKQRTIERGSGLSDVILSTVDTLGYGCIILDGKGRIVETNSKAARYLGWTLEIRRSAHDSAQPPKSELLGLLREALRKSSQVTPFIGYIIAVPRDARKPLLLRSLKIEREPFEPSGSVTAAVVMLDLEDCPRPSAELLKQVFGLTPAEARLAQRLSCGEDLRSVSRSFGVSVETLRMQLKAVFWKTGTCRQAELAALLAHLSRLSPT